MVVLFIIVSYQVTTHYESQAQIDLISNKVSNLKAKQADQNRIQANKNRMQANKNNDLNDRINKLEELGNP